MIVGKTRTDELGLGALTPGASDPRDAGRSPGGSSGGSAIAVATGAALLALATDTAGSARIPAAACGVAGLCAARDWMPTDGVSILAPSFDRLGLIAATAEDLAVAWTALGGTIGEPPERVTTLADDQLGRVEPHRIEAAHEAAHHLSPRPLELTTPSLPQFGPPRATAIGAEAVARHDPRDAESAAARAQLEAAAQSDADVHAARARLDELGAAAPRGGRRRRPRHAHAPLKAAVVGGARTTTDAQLRATGRLTRLCGPVNSSGLVAVSTPQGVQLIARTIETALAAALRLP